MVPKLPIQPSNDFSDGSGGKWENGNAAGAALFWFFCWDLCKKQKKKRSESFHRRRRKALGLHRGKCGEGILLRQFIFFPLQNQLGRRENISR